MALTDLEKKALLDVVRKTIEARLTGRSLSRSFICPRKY